MPGMMIVVCYDVSTETAAGRKRLHSEVKTWEAYATAVAKVLGASQPPVAGEIGR